MKILHLTIKRKWFDMILSGEKKEEYREIKDFWRRRLYYYRPALGFYSSANSHNSGGYWAVNNFDKIKFKNGYSKNAPTFEVECKGIEIGYGYEEWGADKNVKYFVIKLGEVLKTN